MYAIDSKKGKYKGESFKSQLEIKIACLLDLLRADWEYEPELFQLENGVWYRPDFLIKNNQGYGGERFWIECKGAFNLIYKDKNGSYKKREDEKQVLLFSKENPIMVIDDVPNHGFLFFEHFKEWFSDKRKRRCKNAESLNAYNFFWINGRDALALPMSDGVNFYLSYAPKDSMLRESIFEYTMAAYEAINEIDFNQKEIILPRVNIIPTANYSKTDRELFAKKALEEHKQKETLSVASTTWGQDEVAAWDKFFKENPQIWEELEREIKEYTKEFKNSFF